MKLIVPYIGELLPVDSRLTELAKFLGIEVEPVALSRLMEEAGNFLPEGPAANGSCLVVNPEVIKGWVGKQELFEFVDRIVSRFSYLLTHAPRQDSFDNHLIWLLSEGKLQSTEKVEPGGVYDIAQCKEVCGHFSGLSFGPTDPLNDRVFIPETTAVRNLISIDRKALMASTQRGRTEVLFLGSSDVADVNFEVGDAPLTEYFSRLLPATMALRWIFKEKSWRPNKAYACVVVDDPLLRRKYGFLDFEFLLKLMKECNFHTEIAFIPYNCRRTSPQISRMFRDNPKHFALCFHGNDHLSAEFGVANSVLLNTMLQIAERRIETHRQLTDLECDRVMVFPQGKFSVEAMTALRSRNFDAAVNTVTHPVGKPCELTIREVAQPAVLRYGNFPLFIRKYSRNITNEDIAFNLFFGKPILIVEHHNVFQHPEILTSAVARINAIEPKIRWSNLENALSHSVLERRAADGSHRIRAYSRTVRIENKSKSDKQYKVGWEECGSVNRVEPGPDSSECALAFSTNDTGVRVTVNLPAGISAAFRLKQEDAPPGINDMGFKWNAKAFARRRLSEARDNYLSKSPVLLEVARALQKPLLRRNG